MRTVAIALCAGGATVLLLILLLEWGARRLARHRARTAERTRASLLQLFLFFDADVLYVASATLALLVVVGVWLGTGQGWLAVLSGAAATALPACAILFLRRRRLHQLTQQFPDALLMLAGALRAGSSLSSALEHVAREVTGACGQEFGLVLRELRLGVSLDTALESLSKRIGLAPVTLSVAAMRIANASGGGLAEALERSAATLRQTLAIEAKIRALTSQGKLQALIVGALPALLLLILMKLEPREVALLYSTRLGWATLVVILALEAAGVYCIRRIVRIDV